MIANRRLRATAVLRSLRKSYRGFSPGGVEAGELFPMVVDGYSAVVLKIEIELRHTLKMRQTARLFLIFRRRSDYAQNFSVGVAHGHGATRLLRQELCRGKRLF